MKSIKNTLPYLIALIPQILIANYTVMLISVILIGFIAGWFLTDKKVFVKMMIFQFAFFTILFFTTNDNIHYLESVIENIGLPSILLPVIFILFNTLNISILFLFGFKLQKLTFSKVSIKV